LIESIRWDWEPLFQFGYFVGDIKAVEAVEIGEAVFMVRDEMLPLVAGTHRGIWFRGFDHP
jgi:hypothetical protein